MWEKKKDSRPSTKGAKLARGQQQVSSRRPADNREKKTRGVPAGCAICGSGSAGVSVEGQRRRYQELQVVDKLKLDDGVCVRVWVRVTRGMRPQKCYPRICRFQGKECQSEDGGLG